MFVPQTRNESKGYKRCIFQLQGKNPDVFEQQGAGGHKEYITANWEQKGTIPIARGQKEYTNIVEGKRSVL